MKLLLLTASAITTHAHIKITTYDQVDETDKMYFAYKNLRKKPVRKVDLMRIDTNTMNTTTLHFSTWCLEADKDAAIAALHKAIRDKAKENYDRAKAIFETVENGISIVPEIEDSMPESGELKL